jgi:hypothetical protein
VSKDVEQAPKRVANIEAPDAPRLSCGTIFDRRSRSESTLINLVDTGTSSPQHSTSFNAPYFLKAMAAASACFLFAIGGGDRPQKKPET